MTNQLQISPPFWVSKDMCDMLVAAAQQPDLPTKFESWEIFSTRGFIVLDRPFYYPDSKGSLVQIKAIQWIPGMRRESGTTIGEDPTEPNAISMVMFTDWKYEMAMFKATGESIDNTLDAMFRANEVYLEDLGSRYMTAGSVTFPLDGERLETADLATSPVGFMIAFLRLINQKITMIHANPANRAARRRMEGLKVNFPSQVNEVTLRREATMTRESNPTDSPIMWSHRWVVNGHWRHQPYQDGVKKWIFIEPYVKGPAEAPLVTKAVNYKVVR